MGRTIYPSDLLTKPGTVDPALVPIVRILGTIELDPPMEDAPMPRPQGDPKTAEQVQIWIPDTADDVREGTLADPVHDPEYGRIYHLVPDDGPKIRLAAHVDLVRKLDGIRVECQGHDKRPWVRVTYQGKAETGNQERSYLVDYWPGQ